MLHHVLLECDPGHHHEQGDEGQADPEDGGMNVDLVDNCNPSEVRLYGRVHNSYNKYQGRLPVTNIVKLRNLSKKSKLFNSAA